jgi:hypothetical protein
MVLEFQEGFYPSCCLYDVTRVAQISAGADASRFGLLKP